jgi:hypothetical protein
VVSTNLSEQRPGALTPSRAVSIHLYGAAVFLVTESKAHYSQEIELCLEFLDHVQAKNAVAKQAAAVIRRLMGDDLAYG